FGFGLPSACVSIGQRYTVYSKIEGHDWHAVMIDINEVADRVDAGHPFESEVRQVEPPAFVAQHIDLSKLDSGTVIVIEELDRLDKGFRTTQHFVRNMLENAGTIYRKLIPAITLKI